MVIMNASPTFPLTPSASAVTNALISSLHHFVKRCGDGETDVVLHWDGCRGAKQEQCCGSLLCLNPPSPEEDWPQPPVGSGYTRVDTLSDIARVVRDSCPVKHPPPVYGIGGRHSACGKLRLTTASAAAPAEGSHRFRFRFRILY